MFDNGNKYQTSDPDLTPPQPGTSAGNGGDWNRKGANNRSQPGTSAGNGGDWNRKGANNRSQPGTSASNGGDWNRKGANNSRKRLPRQPDSRPRSWWQRNFGNTGTNMVVSKNTTD